jgi:hypothetical protein
MRCCIRRLLVFALAALPACVVPVEPEWTDPPPNDPPTIQSTTPPVGAVLIADPAGSKAMSVSVVLADHNTQDNLYLRWLIDYPPVPAEVSHVAYGLTLAPEGTVARATTSFAPSCADDRLPPGNATHRLMLAVSDRPFAPVDDSAQTGLDQITDGFLVEAVWLFALTCP